MSLTIEELAEFSRRLGADTALWQRHVADDPDQRTYALIWEDENVNAWVLCWNQDHDTGFHDHDVSCAAITVLDGQVREDRLRLGGGPKTRINNVGDTFTVPANAIHRVLHHGHGLAVTIHAYSPPLTRMGAYSIGLDGELQRDAQDGEAEMKATLATV